jgi:hypothetical protein
MNLSEDIIKGLGASNKFSDGEFQSLVDATFKILLQQQTEEVLESRGELT